MNSSSHRGDEILVSSPEEEMMKAGRVKSREEYGAWSKSRWNTLAMLVRPRLKVLIATGKSLKEIALQLKKEGFHGLSSKSIGKHDVFKLSEKLIASESEVISCC